MQFGAGDNVQSEWIENPNGRHFIAVWAKIKSRSQNKSLKQTVTHVTHFAEKAKPAPRYGRLVPPFHRFW